MEFSRLQREEGEGEREAMSVGENGSEGGTQGREGEGEEGQSEREEEGGKGSQVFSNFFWGGVGIESGGVLKEKA